MKRFSSFLIVFALLAFSMPGHSQGLAQYEISNPHVNLTGSYSQPAAYSPVSAAFNQTLFPWYTKLDSPAANTGTDTFKGKLNGFYKSVYSWCHVNQLSGSLATSTVTLYASGDSSLGVDFLPVYTATLTATAKQAVGYSITGWPYTNWWWVFHGAGTNTASWNSGVMVR